MTESVEVKELRALACQLNDLVPAVPEGSQAAVSPLGLLAEIRNLVTALQAGDYVAALRSVNRSITILLGDKICESEDGKIQFEAQVDADLIAGIDWVKILVILEDVVTVVLPLILKRRMGGA